MGISASGDLQVASILDRKRVRTYLQEFNLRSLFIEELGWDHGGADTVVEADERSFVLDAVAHKRGMVAYQHVSDEGTTIPEYSTRTKIEKAVAKGVREHIIVYATLDKSEQSWQWVKREPGRPDRQRSESFRPGDTGERLIQKLENIAFTLDEEDDLTIVDVSGRVRAAFDVEKVTKRFYDRFKKEHETFLKFIEGIAELPDREWYASLVLNRLMFIYFIQKRGFLDNNTEYLRDRLDRVRREHGNGRFNSFYRLFLLKLFHDGLGQPEADRTPELVKLLGTVPFLNGGLFDVHDLEHNNPDIEIPDEAFERIFDFFDAYQWHLDDRPLRNDNEINPDVLGYIFEKYINQKQMGAYYTKEDITGYISRNTIIPFLFDHAKKACPIAFRAGGGVWSLLKDDPDRYFYEAVRHGITYDMHTKEDLPQKRDLPSEIAAGMHDVAKRDGWNEPATGDYALPTETWREHVARRRHYEEVFAKLTAGKVTAINDLITYNLDIERFAQDVISGSEGPELVRAFWKAISAVSILDPTCGSGAFLFAALNILEPIYTACLEAMRGLLDDLQRSQRKHSPKKMSDFRKTLKQVDSHPSERYYILKSIIINNLYGVDIMEEAVEICKLRLFLKLVAQLEHYEQIEPLPDIDFNIRVGNTLVGFTTLKEIQDALVATPDGQRRLLYAEDTKKLRRIEEDAEMADRTFRMFHEMQTEREMDASAFARSKLDLRGQLDELRNQLNRYLAGKYGIKEDDPTAYEQWRVGHQPFHWFVEFYGIMRTGGFNVIIGNPPYVESRNVSEYDLRGYKTESCGDLFAFTLERALFLSNSDSWTGFIVPLSCFSVDRFYPLQQLYLNKMLPLYVSNWSGDAHPSRLFDGVNKRLEILLAKHYHRAKSETSIFTSRYLKWYADERPSLFGLFPVYRKITSPEIVSFFRSSVPKINVQLEMELLSMLQDCRRQVATLTGKSGRHRLYYTRKVSFFLQFLDFVPEVRDQFGDLRAPSELKALTFNDEQLRNLCLCCLSTSLFYWFNTINSDCRNLNRREVVSFPVPDAVSAATQVRLNPLLTSLMQCYKENSRTRTVTYKSKGRVSVQYFNFRPAKPIIDQIDHVLGEHYGFTEEQVDYVINYDIKYRMGR